MITILIPTPLRSCTNGHASVSVEGATVGDTMASLVAAYPRLRPQLFDESERLRSFVNLFLNDADIRMDKGLASSVRAGDTLEILPAIAGGSGEALDYLSWRKRLEASVGQASPADAERIRGISLVLDVRSAEEWEKGHLPGAVHVDRGFLEMRIEALAPELEQPILCYCQSGARSLFAAETLARMGYRDVRSLAGGVQRWQAEGRPLEVPARLGEGEARRYARHLSIPEIGVAGQQRLGRSRVLLVGAGGLGCPVALYLAAAGVGHLTLIDDDVVEESNLHRQVLYAPDMVGQPKAHSAAELLARFNPFVSVTPLRERLDATRAGELFADQDVIVDGTDNFRSRYLINDAAIACGKPVVHGAIYRFDGQVSVFGASGRACYRCFSPEAPPPELAPSCAESGVLGVLPGTVGMIMATETIKLLLGIGRTLADRIIHYDALEARFREFSIARRDNCPTCGEGAPMHQRAVAG
jgi:sulfur-carrier protein adenylyltransferase/sulfurtransferase